MKILVEDGILYGRMSTVILNKLARSCMLSGHTVTRNMNEDGDCAIVWNGRCYLGGLPRLIVELGWLPRWGYQISHKGINGNHHLAPWKFDGEVPGQEVRDRVRAYIASVLRGNPRNWGYTRKVIPNGLPEEFFLCPLQIETDTNMQLVPDGIRTMPEFAGAVVNSGCPLPVVFKHHPAQRPPRNDLSVRDTDVMVHANDGTVYGILSHPGCRGVITLNSNTAHDALLYGVPSICLGRHMWPEETGPMFVGFPNDWSEFEEWRVSPLRRDSTLAYIDFLRATQWTDHDMEDPARVNVALQLAMTEYVDRPNPQVVNVVARNKGWLFEDLKGRYALLPDVVCSEVPIPGAASYMYIRTAEAKDAPCPEKTVVQIHDFFEHDHYRNDGIRKAKGLVCTHPGQLSPVDCRDKRALVLPIGASQLFEVKTCLHDTFRVAWVGRATKNKRLDLFVRAVTAVSGRIPNMEVVLLGEGLNNVSSYLKGKNVACLSLSKGAIGYGAYPGMYKTFDVLLVTSDSEAGPLCLFEALATGLPVISRSVGWAPRLVQDNINGFLVEEDPIAFSKAILHIYDNREDWFRKRHVIAATLMGWNIENWIRRTVEFARSFENGNQQADQ